MIVTSVVPMSNSTSTPVSASWWHSGMRSLVRLAARMPATRAVASASPLGSPPVAISSTTSARVRSDARRDGGALGGVLGGHVDHVRRPRVVEVRQSIGAGRHGYLLMTVTGCVYGRSSAGSGNVRSPNGRQRAGAVGGELADRRGRRRRWRASRCRRSGSSAVSCQPRLTLWQARARAGETGGWRRSADGWLTLVGNVRISSRRAVGRLAGRADRRSARPAARAATRSRPAAAGVDRRAGRQGAVPTVGQGRDRRTRLPRAWRCSTRCWCCTPTAAACRWPSCSR